MKFLAVIPHYNHARTLKSVAQDVLRHTPDAAVFDDGSDENPAPLLEGLPVSFVRFEKNRGKGAVILDAARYAKTRGFTHIITIDADGQHNAADIPLLIKAARQNPHALIIGARRFAPPKSAVFLTLRAEIRRFLGTSSDGQKSIRHSKRLPLLSRGNAPLPTVLVQTLFV
ncbi:MAG: glycosyltransferase [Candidatus Avelusimicrobium sp.]